MGDELLSCQHKRLNHMNKLLQSLSTSGTLVILIVLLSISNLQACSGDDDHSAHHSHGDSITRLELSDAQTGELIAIWADGRGWEDSQGASIEQLPLPDLSAGGEPAVVMFRAFATEEVELSAVGIDQTSGEPTCSSLSIRYDVLDAASSVLAWPPTTNPMSTRTPAPSIYVSSADELLPLFECDRAYLHPVAAGTSELRFLFWHGDHADGFTTPIQVMVD